MCTVHACPIKENEEKKLSAFNGYADGRLHRWQLVELGGPSLERSPGSDRPIQSITKDQITNKERLHDSLVTSTLPEGWLPCSPDVE